LTASYLIVAGGGGGATGNGGGGGGGAGGMVTGSGLVIDTNSNYLVTVGAGGAGVSASPYRYSGSNSVFFSASATGGGGGAWGASYPALTGGSGGGGNYQSTSGASGICGQGRTGGSGVSGAAYGGGGGGGAGTVGSNGTTAVGGNGGTGAVSSILPYSNAQSLSIGQVSGASVYYAGGGGGGVNSTSYTSGTGGTGGGGSGGAYSTVSPTAGTANTGGGGGAGGGGCQASASGGSGVVIISYSGSTQLMAGGQVVIAGGNVIHIFTSTGFLTPLKLTSGSLRFRSSASTALVRTPTTASNRKTFTFSTWAKLGTFKDDDTLFSSGSGVAAWSYLAFNSGSLAITETTSGAQYTLVTTQVFRDPSAWYHIVVAFDTTQATASNRIKFYVNGSQITSFSTANYPTQNYNTYYNSATQHGIGRLYDGGSYYSYDGYLAEVNLVDGLQLTPTSFGSYNSYGVWQPITYSGAYGTNGFYLPFNKGQLAYAGLFNGSNQYLSTPTSTNFNLGTSSFTLEYWMNANSFATATVPISGGGSAATYDPQFGYGNAPSVIYLSSTGSSWDIASGVTIGTIKPNQWYHIAIVRSGNTFYTFLNGVQGATFTSSASIYQSTNAFIIGQGQGTQFVNGQISNVRFVKGTALYTTNFIPSTSPLTAVSGTQLLTLQNTTIVDNSTNAFSITNNSTVTIVKQYPFSTGVFNDQGPAGNNFTPVNISAGTSTSYAYTLDLMNDSPTLTNSTSSNYAVLNPSGITGATSMTLSNGNLSFTWATASNKSAYSTIGMSSGKWYCEVIYTSVGSSPVVGISSVTGADPSTFCGFGATQYAYESGVKHNNNASVAYGATFTNNDVIGIAFDADAGSITFYKNGASQGVAYSSIPAGTYVFGVSGNNSTGNINFGQQPFQYTPPTGYLSLNTYNLPAPTIPNGRLYMDATLYTGTGGTQTIYNAATFQPDLVWYKSRSYAYNHGLYDSVRGATAFLKSNSTDAETTLSGVTSFNSNGFTAGTDAGVSANSYTFVGWQWKAGGTAVSNTAGSITSSVSANTTSGFSVVTYTGTGANATVGHGLGVAPNMIIIKNRTTAGTDWNVYHSSLGNTNVIYLDLTNASASSSTNWNNTSPTSSVFTVGTVGGANGSGANLVAYCFAPIAGYSAFGSYTGNGSADGPFVFTNFQARWLLIKRTDSTQNWFIWDTSRSPSNVIDDTLEPNLSDAENLNDSTLALDVVSNGFKIRTTGSGVNTSSGTYIYMAFATNPFKYANAR
jgi:hypothetical protein